MSDYHYTECGLDHVFIEGGGEFSDHSGEDSVTIPAIGQLHSVIAEVIVTHPAKITGQELRFLRTEMGLTQAQLAAIVKVTPLTVSRWERNESPANDTAEMLIRILAVETLELGIELGVRSVSEKVTDCAWTEEIRIDGSISGHYRLLEAA